MGTPLRVYGCSVGPYGLTWFNKDLRERAFSYGLDGHGPNGLQGGRSPKRLDKIFSFCIFMNLLNPLELPISLVAPLKLKKLTAIQLGCVKSISPFVFRTQKRN